MNQKSKTVEQEKYITGPAFQESCGGWEHGNAGVVEWPCEGNPNAGNGQ